MCSALLQWPVGPEGCKNVVCVCSQDNHNFKGKKSISRPQGKGNKTAGHSYVFYVWFLRKFYDSTLVERQISVCVRERHERIKLYPFADEKNLQRV
jgi:hypothetical protein